MAEAAPGTAAAARAPVAQSVAVGAALLVTGLASFAGMEAAAKLIGGRYSPVEIAWARYLVHLILLSGLLFWMKPADIVRTRRPVLHIVRASFIVTLTVLFFAAITIMRLAEATAVLYTGPLLIVAFSGPVLGERVGWHRWASVAAGFVGVLVIVRPGGEAFGWGALLAFGSALCYASYALITRIMGPTESPVSTVFYTAFVGAVPLSVAVPFVWVTPSTGDLVWLLLPGGLGALGHYLVFLGYRRAPASALAPFTYTHLIWAGLYGFFVFGESPDAWGYAGAAVITAAGLYVWHRERRGALRPQAAASGG
jgi:drug/metabolite transporter (DMT)-like permease